MEVRDGTFAASTEMGLVWLPGDLMGRTMGRQSPGLQDGQCGQPELPTCLCLALMGRQKEMRPQGRGPCPAEDLGVHIGCTRTSRLSARAEGTREIMAQHSLEKPAVALKLRQPNTDSRRPERGSTGQGQGPMRAYGCSGAALDF